MKAALARELISGLGLPTEYLENQLGDLEFMARYKYDHYEMFAPGTRFLEHLFVWLKQFAVEHRKVAIDFLRHHLIFISQREMQDLARVLFYDFIVPEILNRIIKEEHLGRFDYSKAFDTYFPGYLRRSLFIGLSDGAKIDFFRRHHIQLSQEQVLPYYRTSASEYVKRLREDTGDPDAGFWAVFLIDDITASGYTLLHDERDPKSGERKLVGALQRVCEYQPELIERASLVCLCHYIATEQSQQQLVQLACGIPGFQGKFKCVAALTLGSELSMSAKVHEKNTVANKIFQVCELHYDSDYEDENTRRAGGIKEGFGRQNLPLVLLSLAKTLTDRRINNLLPCPSVILV